MKSLLVFCSLIFILFPSLLLAGDNPKSVRAIRVSTPPKIDGILDEEIWKQADPAKDFIQRDPDEGKPGSEPTEIRVVYDDEALYFGCTFYDTEAGKIVSRLTRRDDEIESDRASIRIDSYHDHQTGYEFTFNVAGVKIDILQYDDANKEDESWDPVWDVQTKIVPDGWRAEVKIPLRILRYRNNNGDSSTQTWGVNFMRYISRKQESQRWAFTPKSESGFISRYGHLTGLTSLPSPRQIEVLPFIVGKRNYEPATAYQVRRQRFLGNAGLDLRYGVSSNFTLDAAFNPDFGQVEADPAVLNLTTYETFYPEKRPFFIEGTQIIRFTTFGGDFGPGMFYSRRIGRAISPDEVDVRKVVRIESIPQHTTILGAAKFSGKTNTGLSIGALQAVTEEQRATVADSIGATSEQVLEPFAHYSILRFKQDVLENSNVGMIMTAVEKQSRYPAFTAGVDWNIKLQNNTYQLDGFLALSRTTNSNQERISGSAGKIEYAKIAGEHWLWSLSADFTSKKYNINDVGFFRRPNDFGGVASINFKEDVPAEVVRNYNVGLFMHERRNFDGVNIFREMRFNGQMLFINYWRMTAGAGLDFGMYDDRETRGNGLYRRPTQYSVSASVSSDERNRIFFTLGQQLAWDTRKKRNASTEVGVTYRPLSWMEYTVESEYEIVRDQEAWADTILISGTTNSIFGNRNTDRLNLTLRSTITFTRDLTLQVYGQIFLAKGHYTDFRQLVGTSDFTSPHHYGGDPDFNNQNFNTNIVLRWEYLPGSTIYVVWSQARHGSNADKFTSIGNDVGSAFLLPPSNVILLKASYYWSL